MRDRRQFLSLIATGGTIASTENEEAGAVVATMGSAGLVARLNGHVLPQNVDIVPRDHGTVNSYAMDLATAHGVIGAIRAELAREACAGVVVTHGTDTMEETAFLANLWLDGDKPVVFTGAQRHADDPDSDGPRNIAEALCAAASPAARGLGALILFEGDLHGAEHATKTHASRSDTFRSGDLGKLGEVDRGRLHLYQRPALRRSLPDKGLADGVELMRLGLGAGTGFLDWCLARPARGVVIEAFGRGNAPRGFADAVGRLVAAGIPVVITSRCSEGRTEAIYGADSGAVELVKAGAILAGTLSGIKARLLLAAVLGADESHPPDFTAIREAFET